jgi:methionyl-tRNA synthetase
VSAANLAIDGHKPWELAREDDRTAELDSVLYELVEALRYLMVLVSPTMPEKARAMAGQLGWSLPSEEWMLDSLLESAPESVQVNPGDPLFPRLDPDDFLDPA